MEESAGSTEHKSYKYCKECTAANCLPMVPSDQFKKVANLLNSGIDIYHHLKPLVTTDTIDTMLTALVHTTARQSTKTNKRGLVIHNSGHRDVAKALLNKDLCNYRTNCDLCQANLRKIRCILKDISVIKHHEAIGICTHCRENYANAAATRCPRCEDVAKRFLTQQVDQYNAKERQLRDWIEKVQQLLKSILAAGRSEGGRDAEYDELAKLLEFSICSPDALITAFPSIYGIREEEFLRPSGISMGASDLDGDDEGQGPENTEEMKRALLRHKYLAGRMKRLGGEAAAATKDDWFSVDFLRQVMRHQKTKKKKKFGDDGKKKQRKGRIICNTDPGTVNPSSDTISTMYSNGVIIKEEAVDIISLISLPVAKRRIASRLKRDRKNCKQTEVCREKNKFTDVKESLMNFFKPYEDTFTASTDASRKHPKHGDAPSNPEEDEKVLIAKFFKQYLNMDLTEKPKKVEKEKPPPDDVDADSCSLDIDLEMCTGITSYRLSDDYFIRNGWTQLPYMKTLRRIKIYRMIHTKQEFNWFDTHRHQEVMFYPTGEKLAEIGDHHGRWFYRNGKVALQYLTQSTDPSVQRIYQIYSSGEPMREIDKPVPIRLLAAFDYFGNGILYDNNGKIRLQYNQFEGSIEDPEVGTPGKWKWHTLNDPPSLEFEFTENHCGPKSPFLEDIMQVDRTKSIVFDAKMLAIECQNVMKMKMAYRQFNPIMITMKVLKLNKYISIRVIDQAHIYLGFRDGKTSMKINLGMQLVSNDVVDLIHIDISKFVFLQPREALATGEADLLVQHGPMIGLFDREVNTTPQSLSLKDSLSAAMIEQKHGGKPTASKAALHEGSVSSTKIGKMSSVPTEESKKPAKSTKRASIEIPRQKSAASTKQKSPSKENQPRNKQLDFTLSTLRHRSINSQKQNAHKLEPRSSSTTKATINTTPKK